MARPIPVTITNNAVRMRLAVINEALDILVKFKNELMTIAKSKNLTDDQKKSLNEIIKAHNKLDQEFTALTPSLADISTLYNEE